MPCAYLLGTAFKSRGLHADSVCSCSLPDDDNFGSDAAALLESWVHNQMLQTQILTHDETTGVPYILLYKMEADKVRILKHSCTMSHWSQGKKLTNITDEGTSSDLKT